MSAKLGLKTEDEKILDQWLEEIDKKLGLDDESLAAAEAASVAAVAQAKAAIAAQPKPEPVVQWWTPEPVDPLKAAQKACDKQKADLDKDVAAFHRQSADAIKAGKNVDASRLSELQARAAALKAEQDRIRRESFLKDNYKRKFLAGGIGTASDFDRIWNTKMRDEALLDQAAGKGTQHSFWDEF